jgi:hypothetical protein
LTALEQKVEGSDDVKTKLELSFELEKTRATALQEDVDRLNQSLAEFNVSLCDNFLNNA